MGTYSDTKIVAKLLISRACAKLGAQITGNFGLENELRHSSDILAKSVALCTAIFTELLDYAREKRIPLGINVESVSIRKAEIDASVELYHRLRAPGSLTFTAPSVGGRAFASPHELRASQHSLSLPPSFRLRLLTPGTIAPSGSVERPF